MNIAIAAAGTGGHIFPAKAVAEALLVRDTAVFWYGVGGMERQLLQDADVTMVQLPAKPVMGRELLAKAFGLMAALRSVLVALMSLRANKIKLVFVFGGYVSFPVGVAARLLRIPLIIHEQNKIAGRANLVLAKFTRHVLSAFPEAFPGMQSTVVGNPLRREIYELAQQSRPERIGSSPLKVLVLGGSQGADFINQLIVQLCEQMGDETTHVTIRLQCGKQHFPKIQARLQSLPCIQVQPFITDMADAYGWADVVIARAGALTVSECLALQLPTLYIPLPTAIADHQTLNAQFAVQQSSSLCLPQAQASVASLQAWLATCHAKVELQRQPKVVDDVALKIIEYAAKATNSSKLLARVDSWPS